MTQKIQFELVSPEAKLISEAVKMAVIPGEEGDFGVLFGHAPIVAQARAGVVDVYRENMKDKSESIFIAGGFADVSGETCTLLAEQAIKVSDIDVSDVEKQISDLESDLKIAEGEGDKKRFQQKLNILRAMWKAAS